MRYNDILCRLWETLSIIMCKLYKCDDEYHGELYVLVYKTILDKDILIGTIIYSDREEIILGSSYSFDPKDVCCIYLDTHDIPVKVKMNILIYSNNRYWGDHD